MAMKIKRSTGKNVPVSLENGQLGYSYGLSGLYIGTEINNPAELVGGKKLLDSKIDTVLNASGNLAVFRADGQLGSINRNAASIGPISGITVNGKYVAPVDRIVDIEIKSESIDALEAWSGVINNWSGKVDSNLSDLNTWSGEAKTKIDSLEDEMGEYVRSILTSYTNPTLSADNQDFISGLFMIKDIHGNNSSGLLKSAINSIPISAVEKYQNTTDKVHVNNKIPSTLYMENFVKNKLTSSVEYKGKLRFIESISEEGDPLNNAISGAIFAKTNNDKGFVQGDWWQIETSWVNNISGQAKAIYTGLTWDFIRDYTHGPGEGLELNGEVVDINLADDSLIINEGLRVNISTDANNNLSLSPNKGLFVPKGISSVISGDAYIKASESNGVVTIGFDHEKLPGQKNIFGDAGINATLETDGWHIGNTGVLSAAIYGADAASGAIAIPAPQIKYNDIVITTATTEGILNITDIDDGTW